MKISSTCLKLANFSLNILKSLQISALKTIPRSLVAYSNSNCQGQTTFFTFHAPNNSIQM